MYVGHGVGAGIGTSSMIIKHLIISGRVQGVCYRDWTVGKASTLGLDGWVRNRRDGTVEAVISGSDDAVEAMIAACRRGPEMAEVAEIKVSDWAEEVPTGFVRRETV